MTEVLGKLALPHTILIPVNALLVVVHITAASRAGATDATSRGRTAHCYPMTDHGRATIRPNISVSATTVVPDVLPCLAESSESNAGDA
jgi:hypothetical protein